MRRGASILAALTLSVAAAAPTFALGTKQQLSQTLPELRFEAVTLGDAIDFLRDVSGANIAVNWKALDATGVSRDTQVNLHVSGITLRKALEMTLSEAAGGDALTFYVDEGVISITTRDLADHSMVTCVYPVEDLLMEIPDFTDAPQVTLDNTSSQGGGGGGTALGQGGGGGQISTTNNIFGNSNSTNNQNRVVGTTKVQRAQDLISLIEAVVNPDIWKDNGGAATCTYFNGMLIVTAPRSVQEAIGG
jgi:hypothetical protein